MVSVDFLVVPTIRFQILYVFLVLAHERRRILHFAVTAHPTAEWTAQQRRKPSCCAGLWLRRRNLHTISQSTELPDQPASAFPDSFRVGSTASFLVLDVVMENLPDQAAQPVGHGPYGHIVLFGIAATNAAVVCLEYRALSLDGRIGRLVENPAHRPIAFGRMIACGLLRGFLLSRTAPHPGAQVGRRRERGRLRTHFGDDRLR